MNQWVFRTRNLSSETIRFRELLKSAHDPNKLLFEDLPNFFKRDDGKSLLTNDSDRVKSRIIDILNELTNAYPKLLHELGVLILSELQVGTPTDTNIRLLNERAKSIKGLSGDFRVDSFISRLCNFEQSEEHIAGIASLAANKPIKDWIDLDVEKARQEIVYLCSGFKKAETLSRVKGKDPAAEQFQLLRRLLRGMRSMILNLIFWSRNSRRLL